MSTTPSEDLLANYRAAPPANKSDYWQAFKTRLVLEGCALSLDDYGSTVKVSLDGRELVRCSYKEYDRPIEGLVEALEIVTAMQRLKRKTDVQH